MISALRTVDVSGVVGRLREARQEGGPICLSGADALELLNLVTLERIYAPQLSSSELKLIDKHCDWVAFKHAFNCVMKHRLGMKYP